jgi:hypothetical protein
MLSKVEELRLDALLELTTGDPEQSITFTDEYSFRGVKWLANKLKETNDELKSVYEEVALNLRSQHKDPTLPVPCKRAHCEVCGT